MGFPRRQRRDRPDHALRVRQGRLEEEAPARRGGGADPQSQRRDPERRRRPLARVPDQMDPLGGSI